MTRVFFNGPGVNEVLAIAEPNGAGASDGYSTVWQFADHAGTVPTVGRYYSSQWQIMHRAIDAAGNQIEFALEEGQKAALLGDKTIAPLLSSPIIYAGHQWDYDLELYDAKARWYDPHAQRMLSEDPARSENNLYRYAAGDPVNYVDPDGREPFSILAYAVWSGVNAIFDTVVETAFTYAFSTDQEWANYSIRGTLGKNFAINLATAGLGNKAKWAFRLGRYAADVGIGTLYDVYAGNKSFGSALASNALGTAAGEVVGLAARRVSVQFHRPATSQAIQGTAEGSSYSALRNTVQFLRDAKVTKAATRREIIENGLQVSCLSRNWNSPRQWLA